MCFFDRSLRQLLTRELIAINLSFRFVDDSRIGLRTIEPGWRWNGKSVTFVNDKVEEDIAMGPQKRTTNLFTNIHNSLVTYLRFTTEDHLDFENCQLPTLDCSVWVDSESCKILHKFYEKPQVGNRGLLENTALSEACLDSSLIQEGVR